MAKPLTSLRSAILGATSTLFLGALFPLSAGAQTLSDPTRPPAAKAAGEAISAPSPDNPVLQSVMIANGRRSATINGKSFSEGDMVGEARVVRIVENEVTLRVGKRMQILKVFPGVEKHQTVAEKHFGIASQR